MMQNKKIIDGLHYTGFVRCAPDKLEFNFVIRGGNKTVYYSGDTEFFGKMNIIREKYKPDIAILNINLHLPSREAQKVTKVIDADIIIPGHHGAYWSPYISKNTQWRAELKRKLTNQYVEILVGELVSLVDE